MSGLVYVIAAAPWGPVKVGHASSSGAMLRQVTTAPAHVEDCGALDASRVAAAARAILQPTGGDDWIACKVAAAVQAVKEAHGDVLARVVAGTPSKASQRPPDVDDGTDRFRATHADARGDVSRVDAASLRDDRPAPAPAGEAVAKRVAVAPTARRPSGDVDVRAIRAGLRMTQAAFAAAFGMPLATLRDWEQGRAAPDGSARTLLRVIEMQPKAVRAAVATL